MPATLHACCLASLLPYMPAASPGYSPRTCCICQAGRMAVCFKNFTTHTTHLAARQVEGSPQLLSSLCCTVGPFSGCAEARSTALSLEWTCIFSTGWSISVLPGLELNLCTIWSQIVAVRHQMCRGTQLAALWLQVVVDAIDPSVIVSQCASKEFHFGTVTEAELINFSIPLKLQIGRRQILAKCYEALSAWDAL